MLGKFSPKIETVGPPSTSSTPITVDLTRTPTIVSAKVNCLFNKIATTTIGPYAWSVRWVFLPNGLQSKLRLEVLKTSNYVFNWTFRMNMEFQDFNLQPIKKSFVINDTHLMQIYEFNEVGEPDFSRMRCNSAVIMQWFATRINYFWENFATEIELEDPKRTHDFILIASKTKAETEHFSVPAGTERAFYVHLSYLRAYSGYFQKLLVPESPHLLTNVDPNILSVLLSIIYPNMADSLNEKNVVHVIKLAKQLEMYNVVNAIAEELRDSRRYPNISIIHRLRIGDSFRHRNLIISCLQLLYILPKDLIRSLVYKEMHHMRSMSQEIMSELLLAVTSNYIYMGEQFLKIKHLDYYQIVPESECDKVLIIAGEEISVNSVVLATWSEVFDELFFNNPFTKHSERFPFDNVAPGDFRIILRLIQSKNILILTEDTVVSVLEAAHYLKMPSIIAMCCSFITNYGHDILSNALKAIQLGERVNSGNLIEIALNKMERIIDKQTLVKNNLQTISTLSETTKNNMFIAIAARHATT